MIKGTFGLLFWAHLAVILIGYTAWALFDWRLVIGGTALYYIQIAVVGGCVLSRAQFGSASPGQPRTTFYTHYLARLGITVSDRQIDFFADYLVPSLVVIFSIVAQKIFGLQPLWL